MSNFTVKVCKGRACSERHSQYIERRLIGDVDFYKYGDAVVIEPCLCQGRCKEGPTVVYENDIQIWQNPVKASELLKKKVAEWKRRISNTSKNSSGT